MKRLHLFGKQYYLNKIFNKKVRHRISCAGLCDIFISIYSRLCVYNFRLTVPNNLNGYGLIRFYGYYRFFIFRCARFTYNVNRCVPERILHNAVSVGEVNIPCDFFVLCVRSDSEYVLKHYRYRSKTCPTHKIGFCIAFCGSFRAVVFKYSACLIKYFNNVF